MLSDTVDAVTTTLSGNGEWLNTAALPYTANPWRLAWTDILLFFSELPYLPWICSPLTPFKSGELDELYPSRANLFCIAVHLVLSIAQVIVLISLPISLFWPAPFGILTLAIYVVSFIVINKQLADWLLNGPKPFLRSKVDVSRFPKHDDEQWIFLNGVAAGKHWLQSNIDRIAMSFGRPVLGMHNPTTGMIFDVVQCLIQRDFNYATQDIRNAYAELKKSLGREDIKKVVFIMHSQGGIEGSLILDWLYADAPGQLIKKLEVYTFGNASNHFNDPKHASDHNRPGNVTPKDVHPERRAIRHIEHYANSRDFVSKWGVLFFASQRAGHNRFRGRVYERNGTGHQFNQHYMDYMFPLDEDKGYGLAENNAFMATPMREAKPGQKPERGSDSADTSLEPPSPKSKVVVRNLTYPSGSESNLGPNTSVSEQTVGDISRLWMYRNGRTPPD